MKRFLYQAKSLVSTEAQRLLILKTHWSRVTHICVGNLTIIGSDIGLSPHRHQAIIWTNAGLLLIRHVGTNFGEISNEILTFSFKKMRLKRPSAKWRPFCLGLNVLNVDPDCIQNPNMVIIEFVDVIMLDHATSSASTIQVIQIRQYFLKLLSPINTFKYTFVDQISFHKVAYRKPKLTTTSHDQDGV